MREHHYLNIATKKPMKNQLQSTHLLFILFIIYTPVHPISKKKKYSSTSYNFLLPKKTNKTTDTTLETCIPCINPKIETIVNQNVVGMGMSRCDHFQFDMVVSST